MIRRVGSWPKRKAGKATDAQRDFNDLGGTVITRRVFLPCITCVSSYAMSSICQLGKSLSPGETRGKKACTKAYKSVLRTASIKALSSEGASNVMIVFV